MVIPVPIAIFYQRYDLLGVAEVAQQRLQRAGLDVSRTQHEINTLPGYARLFLTLEAKANSAPGTVTLIANLWLSEWAYLERTDTGRFVTTWPGFPKSKPVG